MSAPIISSQLPSELVMLGPHDVMVVRATADTVRKHFQQAQREAIERFCRRVQDNALELLGHYPPNGSEEECLAEAFLELRQQLQNEKEQA